jgi:hypothetical protein
MRVSPVIPAVVACEAGPKNTALETRQLHGSDVELPVRDSPEELSRWAEEARAAAAAGKKMPRRGGAGQKESGEDDVGKHGVV